MTRSLALAFVPVRASDYGAASFAPGALDRCIGKTVPVAGAGRAARCVVRSVRVSGDGVSALLVVELL